MITSSSNPLVARLIGLNTRAKNRREQGCFIAEGVKLFRETPEHLREEIVVSESFEREEREILSGKNYQVLDDRLFQKVADTRTPQGILTVARIPSWKPDEVIGGERPLLLVLEDIQDPGNLGTMIRTAEGAGATGVIMSDQTADPFQPKVIRSTMGSVFRVPLVRSHDLQADIARMKSGAISVYAAHLEGSIPYLEGDYAGGTAFLIGNEGRGLSRSLTELADHRIRIPMEGRVESLNASVAAALLLYAAHAQR